jgi:hypothetical protein
VVGIEQPDEEQVPTGPTRDLVVALHELYRGAGRPGLRVIAKAVTRGDFRTTVSHEAVSDMLNGKSVPRWSKLDCVVRQLALWNAPRLDPEEIAARFLPLWEAATGGIPSKSGNPSTLTPDSDARNQEPSPPRSQKRTGTSQGETVVIPGMSKVGSVGRALAEGAAFAQASPKDRDSSEWARSGQALISGQPRWREPADDAQTAHVRHLRDNQSSHPAFSARSSRADSPPTVRIGMSVACNPLPAMQPTSSVIRDSFLSFLSGAPMAGLVKELTSIGHDAKWEKWGGHGRSNHEVVLTGADQQTAPVAWARLLLPEPRMPAGWRDSKSALLLMQIERRPWDVDGPSAPSIPFLDWHTHFMKILKCSTALAAFLAHDLRLEVPADEPGGLDQIIEALSVASVAVWLITPQAMTDLVGISGYHQLPGSPVSPQFDAYAVIHPDGMDASDMAIDWMRQMCDYSLHLDGYDSSLMGFQALNRMIDQP